jgi:glutaminyl-tRNA synthetase
MMSKRKLQQLVAENVVDGWDDPRMPTLAGMRRRGYTPKAIKDFCETIGVTKFNSLTELALLEHCLRQDLNKVAKRAMAVFDPLEVEIENWEDGVVDELEAINNPEDESAGKRIVPFTKRIYIERSDFMENPPKKFFRLTPDNEVRLRYAYFMRCKEIVKDANGNIVKLICTIDPASRGGNSPDGRKVKGTIHWVSAEKSLKATAMLYSTLFTREDMSVLPEGSDFKDFLNPESLVEKEIFIEPSLKDAKAGEPLQFERVAYFMADSKLSTPEHPVFNRTVELKDSYGK